MMYFGDGREERMAAAMLESRLRACPKTTARREAYETKVRAARQEAEQMSEREIIDRLCEDNPAYIRSLLETETSRQGEGSLQSRYARSFYNSPRSKG